MGVKRTIKKKAIKVHRKIFGKPKEVMITTGKGGLLKAEIEDVIKTLGNARRQGKIPACRYEYKPPIAFLRGREMLILIPKTDSVLVARAKIRKVMKAKYGTKYIVV